MTTYSRKNADEMTESTALIDSPRSIDVLLKSTTYQGMTDEEIGRIIAYKEDLARKEESNKAMADAVSAQTEAMRAHWRELAAQTEAAFNAAVFSAVKFQTVEGV